MRKGEKTFLADIVQHFTDKEFGGYPIRFNAKYTNFIKVHMPYLTILKGKDYDTVSLTGEVDQEHYIMMLERELEYYKNELYSVSDELRNLSERY